MFNKLAKVFIFITMPLSLISQSDDPWGGWVNDTVIYYPRTDTISTNILYVSTDGSSKFSRGIITVESNISDDLEEVSKLRFFVRENGLLVEVKKENVIDYSTP